MSLFQYIKFEKLVHTITNVTGLLAIISFFAQHGFNLTPKTQIFLVTYIDQIIVSIFVLLVSSKFLLNPEKLKYIKENPVEFTLGSLFVSIVLLYQVFTFSSSHYLISFKLTSYLIKAYFIFVQFYIVFNTLVTFFRSREKGFFYSINPARLFALSFLFVIIAGTCFLKLPKATIIPISWIDALFMSTSAVCVTGLATINISEVFTIQGQAILIFLMQIGGLGMVTLTAFIALFIQRGIRLKDQFIVGEILDDANISSLYNILKYIIKITLFFEIIGVILLYIFWNNSAQSDFDRILNAVFHAVSAYCNAGLSNLPQGLQSPGFSTYYPPLIVIMILIIAGGFGFYTIMDIINPSKIKFPKGKRLKLQTRVVIYSYLALIFGGALLIWLFQRPQWKDLPWDQQIMNSLFTSVVSRTAGFSVVEVGTMLIPPLMIVIFMMYIGGAPNSTAGGIKVTTAVTLMVSLWGFIKGKERIELARRTIPMVLIRKAFIVLVSSVLLIFTALLILTITEKHSYFDLFFETVSAFGTVGLSRGITPFLTDWGKLIIIFVMYTGRIGLVTLALVVTDKLTAHKYRYPDTTLMI
ncbi:MAG: TrkH family potassium uptake protein [Bacteroidales bacterium]